MIAGAATGVSEHMFMFPVRSCLSNRGLAEIKLNSGGHSEDANAIVEAWRWCVIAIRMQSDLNPCSQSLCAIPMHFPVLHM